MKRFLAWFTAQVIYLIGATMRLTMEDRGGILDKPDHPPVIIAFWHNRTALMTYFCWRFIARERDVFTFISRSRDGQFITDVAARFEIKAVRGSSSRHGMSAALAAMRASKGKQVDLAITPDGPRGPRYQIQPGLIRLAQATGRPIVTVNYDLKWKRLLKSWDRFHVPIPFSKCHLHTSHQIHVPGNVTEEELATITERVSASLGADDNTATSV